MRWVGTLGELIVRGRGEEASSWFFPARGDGEGREHVSGI